MRPPRRRVVIRPHQRHAPGLIGAFLKLVLNGCRLILRDILPYRLSCKVDLAPEILYMGGTGFAASEIRPERRSIGGNTWRRTLLPTSV